MVVHEPKHVMWTADDMEMCLYHGGLIRFGYPRERLVRWPVFAEASKLTADLKDQIDERAERGNDPDEMWYVSPKAIPISEIAVIQRFEWSSDFVYSFDAWDINEHAAGFRRGRWVDLMRREQEPTGENDVTQMLTSGLFANPDQIELPV